MRSAHLLFGLLPFLAVPAAAQTLTFRTTPVATIPGRVLGATAAPAVNRIYYVTANRELWMYDRVRKTSARVTNDNLSLSTDGSYLELARSGDRLAFVSTSDNGNKIWTLPLDSSTGLAAGPAQRVSLSDGDTPSFSPDGRWIAFGAYSTERRGQQLTIVPATGGAERVISQPGTGIEPIRWSPDGKVLYFGTSDRKIQSVPFDGGAVTAILNTDNSSWPGLSPDGNVFAYAARSAPQHLLGVASRAGNTLGTYRPGARAQIYSWLSDSSLLALKQTELRSVGVVSVPGGAASEIVKSSRQIFWSPDSRRIATVLDETNGGSALVIMAADGSGKRSFPLRATPIGNVVWSPDGRSILYRGEETSSFFVLNLANGSERELPTGNGLVAQRLWRSDGRAILYVRRDSVAAGERLSIHEVTLEGANRMVRDLSTTFPSNVGLYPTGSPFFAATVVDTAIHTYIVPLTGEPPRKVITTSRAGARPAFSSDGKRIAWRHGEGAARLSMIDVIIIENGTRSTIKVPFTLSRVAEHGPFFHPDGRHLIAVSSNGSDQAIYLVPLDGTPPRKLTSFASEYAWILQLSPDGTRLALMKADEVTSMFSEIHISGLRRTGARALR